MSRLLILMLGLLLSVFLNQGYAAEQFRLSATSYLSSNGVDVVPVRIRVDASVATPAEIHIFSGANSTNKTVDLAAGSNTFEVLLPPQARLGRQSLQLRLPNGKIIRENHLGLNSDEGEVVILIEPSTEIETQIKTLINSTSGGKSYSYALRDLTRLTPELTPWQWQAWPLHANIIVSQAGWQGMSERQRQALRTHLRWTNKPSWWQQIPPDAPENARPLARALARGEHWLDDMERDYKKALSVPEPEPIPNTDRVPAGGFLVISILFALAAGPGLLAWSRKRGERWRLLLGTPILSAATCIILLGWGLIAEGWTVQRSVSQSVKLFADGQALITQQCTWYAPLGISNLRLPPQSLLIPLSAEEWENINEEWARSYPDGPQANSLRFNHDSGLQAGGSWVPARRNRTLIAATAERWSDHLLIRYDDDGTPVLEHRLLERGGSLSALQYIDVDDQVWTLPAGQTMAPGTAVRLQATAPKHRGNPALAAGSRPVGFDHQPARGMVAAAWTHTLPIPGPTATDAVTTRTQLLCWPRRAAEDAP